MKRHEEKSELQRIVEVGAYGPPKLRPEEKKMYLGEFRERVLLALLPEELHYEEALEVVKKALKDPRAHRLIVNQKKISKEYNRKYMLLTKDSPKEYKSYLPETKDAVGLVIASKEAVNKEDIRVKLNLLPDKFQHADHRKLCKECYLELSKKAPDRLREFQRLNALDKILGKSCGTGH